MIYLFEKSYSYWNDKYYYALLRVLFPKRDDRLKFQLIPIIFGEFDRNVNIYFFMIEKQL